MDAENDKVRDTALKLIYMYVSQVHSGCAAMDLKW